MAKQFVFNPLTSSLDYVNSDVQIVSSDPVTGTPGVFYQVSGDPTKVWYFDGSGNRYYITGTKSNPIGGRTYGILLAIPIT